MDIGRPIEQQPDRNIDISFKLERVHYTILKEAKQNDGIYDQRLYREMVRKKHPLDKKQQQKLILWNQTTLGKMEQAGLLKKEPGEKEKYRLTQKVESLFQEKAWVPKKNHIKLLKKNQDGILRSVDLKKEHDGKKEYEAKRQKNMIEGMIKNLCDNGYLDRVDRGVYKLTKYAEELCEKDEVERVGTKQKAETIQDEVKITYYDRHIKGILNEDGKLDHNKLKDHPKKASLEKRIETLKAAGLILEDAPTKEFHDCLDRTIAWVKKQELVWDDMTKEQQQLVKDIRIFLNLSFTQIAKYIYQGDKKLARADLDYFVKRKVLKRDADTGVYVFDVAGVRLSNQYLEGKDVVRYKTKLESRKEEMEHDMLVYTAYQEFAKELRDSNCKILSVKNDRQLRHDDAKKYGHMVNGYPDLRITYQRLESEKIVTHDIEIDCGYDGKTIASKIEKMIKGNQDARGRDGLGSISWYCRNIAQAAKVANIFTKNNTKGRRITQRKIYLFVLSDDGKVHQVRWQRELLNRR